MRTNLAWRNLAHELVRTAVAAAGVAFAVVLIFMQLGFFRSLQRSATVIYDALNFDICLCSKDYLRLADARTIPRKRLYQAGALPEIVEANPFHVTVLLWRTPSDGQKRGILVMAAPAGRAVFRREDIQRRIDERLSMPDVLLIDRLSRKEFGPLDGKRFGDLDVAARAETEISQRKVRIVGHFALGAGFAANGAVLLSEEGFARVAFGQGREDVSLGLLRVNPADRRHLDRVAQELRELLPDDVDVLTRGAVLARERDRWVQRTSYGLIFQLGIGVAIVVGTAIVYQVLSSDVTNLLPEYATLKAMGYGNRSLAGVVLQQALALAVLGFLPGYAFSHGLYLLTAAWTRIPILMTLPDFLLVFALAILMCGLSGLGAATKVFRADPASLF